MKLRKDYEKELQIQTALGTLGRFCVSRPVDNNPHNDLFQIQGRDEWFISCEVYNEFNAEHAIDVVMIKYGFPENVRKYLSANRMLDE